MTWVQKRGGGRFDLLRPTIDSVNILDIANSLSRICRFSGDTIPFYTVAQHSVEVSLRVPREHALCGLLHDAAEAYTGDLTTPYKEALLSINPAALEAVKEIERRINVIIGVKYGVGLVHLPECVKTADFKMLATERRDFMRATTHVWSIDVLGFDPYAGARLDAWPLNEVEERFLNRFYELT